MWVSAGRGKPQRPLSAAMGHTPKFAKEVSGRGAGHLEEAFHDEALKGGPRRCAASRCLGALHGNKKLLILSSVVERQTAIYAQSSHKHVCTAYAHLGRQRA